MAELPRAPVPRDDAVETPPGDPQEPKPYRLGILFVHGMGEQERGDTITQMGDALSDWFRRSLANREERVTDFSIREATLRGSQSTTGTTAVSVSGLAHASVVLTGPDKEGTRSEEWLLAESWWADAFRPATFSELAAWAIAVGPWLIASQEAGLRQRMRLANANQRPALWRRALDVLLSWLVIFLAALVAAVITPLAIGLLALSLIPVPGVSGAIRGLVQNLSGSFGDLLVLVRSPVRFAAMAERVRSDIDWVHERADRVMVVAHSQGSAVSWHAIRRTAQVGAKDRSRVDLFLTFGQAFRKLKALHRIHTRAPGVDQFWFGILATLSTLLILAAALQTATAVGTLIGEEGSVGEAWALVYGNVLAAAGLLAVLGVVQFILRTQAEDNDDQSEIDILKDLRKVQEVFQDFAWIDLWASADPAPNGPLFKKPVDGVRSVRIRNLASTVFDHSVYWSNVTEFVSAVAYAASSLVDWSPLGPESVPARLREASSVRERRVSMLALGRVAVFAGLIGVLWALRDFLPEIGTEVLRFVQTLPFVPEAWLTNWHSIWKGVVAAALLAAAAGLTWWILSGVWNAVIRQDEGAFFGDGDQPVFTPLAAVWAVAALAVPTAALLCLWLLANRGDGLILYAVMGVLGILIVVVLLRGREPRLSDP